MNHYMQLLAALAAQPWALQKEKLLAMLNLIALHALGKAPNAMEDDEIFSAVTPQRANAIAKKEGNIAMIPVYGLINQRMNARVYYSGGTATDLLMTAMKSALADSSIKAIVMDVDSPGGGVYGVAEIADFIQASRGDKPIIAQVNSLAASAGYWIASAADEIVVTRGGEAGSIGVYMLHEDISKFLDEMGVKETFIFEGKYKVEGNPFEPLNDEAKDYFQSRVSDYYKMFIDSVAKGRGISTKTVLEKFGQGRVFGAQQAVESGMADRVGTLDETLARYGIARTTKTRSQRERELNLAEKI